MKKAVQTAIAVLAMGLVVFALSLALAKEASAQTFECVAVGPAARCQVSPLNNNCSEGEEADPEFCAQFHGDANACNQAVGNCISLPEPQPEGTYRCRWTGNPQLAFRCVATSATCGEGFEAGNACRTYANSPESCNNAGPFDCVSEETCGGLGEDCCTVGAQCEGDLVCASGVCSINQSGLARSNVNPLCVGEEAIDTAIGCIPIDDKEALLSFFLRWAVGIGGGISFILILVSGFQIMTSAGNPERLKAGRELMTSAIAGLILLIFSVIVLKIIGVDILQLPGLK